MTDREDFKGVLHACSEEVLGLVQATRGDKDCETLNRALAKVLGRLRTAESAVRGGSIAEIKMAIKEVMHCIKFHVEGDLVSDKTVLTKQVVRELVKIHFDLRDYVIPDSLKLKNYSTKPGG